MVVILKPEHVSMGMGLEEMTDQARPGILAFGRLKHHKLEAQPGLHGKVLLLHT